MKSLLPLLLLVCVLAAIAAAPVATPPAGNGNKGKVLILENERILEGNIERVGAQYLIRRSLGETWVPADRVLAMCQDKEEAYRFLRARANLGDADEHLKLAHWCHVNGLPARALAEVEAAVALRPAHSPTKQLLAHLQQASAGSEAAVKTNPMAPMAKTAPPPPPIDLTEEALGQFATRVQPILMNTCAGCHNMDKGGAFKLTRTYDATLLNRKALQQNLAAVLSQVNSAQPSSSPLLTKSVSVHGNLTQSPLKSRQAVAYRTLEDWVRKAVGDNPQLRESATSLPPSSTAVPPSPRTVPTTPVQLPPAEIQAPGGITPVPASLGGKTTPKEEEKPADPFDPAEFNRQALPDKGAKP